ncbi:MAG: HEAT repeat domain-containing protein [Myxococcales bacterium]|nr:HEAT repeat domain-containing protein [Myxococcales bacterium]
MARRRSIDEQVRAIQGLRDVPDSPEVRTALADGLASKHSVLTAAAAQVIARTELQGLEEQLVAAFERLMHEPVKRDKGCFAKTAIADALYRLECDQDALFLRGIRHTQFEPVYGGREDTAATLRGTSALALVRCHHPGVMLELARLLSDPQATARVAAADAIAYTLDEGAGAPLLRFKILTGDADVRVTAACFGALLRLSREQAISFVAECALDQDHEAREAAVLALGEARLKDALAPLSAIAEEPASGELAQVAHLAIAMLRNDAAWDYLVETIEDASEPRARAAIEALSHYRHDSSLHTRVMAATAARADPQLEAFAAARFA